MKKFIIVVVVFVSIFLSGCNTSSTQKESPRQEEKTTEKQDTTRYEEYNNTRCNYSITYPNFLFPQAESDNGDGITIQDKDGNEIIRIFCYLNLDVTMESTVNLKEKFDETKNGLSRVSTDQFNGDSFEIAGYEGGFAMYYKTISKKEEDSLVDLLIKYPATEEKTYSNVVATIMKSLQ